MAQRDFFNYGVLTGALIIVGADGLHWFITPTAHPGASPGRTVAVVLQTVVALGIAFGLFIYHQRTRSQPPNAA